MAAQDLDTTSVAAPLTCKLRVRYAECDPQGVVFNANFLSYFDIGITELFRAAFDSLGNYQATVERGVEFVVAEAGLRYRRPAHFDDELTLEVVITRLGTTSITSNYQVLREGELLVDGTVRHVLVDLKRLAERQPDLKTQIPDWMRGPLARYLDLADRGVGSSYCEHAGRHHVCCRSHSAVVATSLSGSGARSGLFLNLLHLPKMTATAPRAAQAVAFVKRAI